MDSSSRGGGSHVTEAELVSGVTRPVTQQTDDPTARHFFPSSSCDLHLPLSAVGDSASARTIALQSSSTASYFVIDWFNAANKRAEE